MVTQLSKHVAPLTRLRYFLGRDAYIDWLHSPAVQGARHVVEKTVIDQLRASRAVPFYCYAHDGAAELLHSEHSINGEIYNWRESGDCSQCRSITRIRLVAEYFRRASQNYIAPEIYLTEQLTPFYRSMRRQYPQLIGSEFVPTAKQHAVASLRLQEEINDRSVLLRHEDGCALTFNDESLDLIGSFDVLEHIPDYEKAMSEFVRVLRPGGQLILSVPFLAASQSTLVRARLTGNNAEPIEHLETPEYHGNPTDPDGGALCFYHFGWDLLDVMRRVGFRAVAMADAWSAETAIFGGQQFIVATK